MATAIDYCLRSMEYAERDDGKMDPRALHWRDVIWKLRLVVKIIPLPTTIVAQRAQTNIPTRPSSITLRGGISSDAKLCSADDRRSLYGTKDGACLSTTTCELGDLAPQRRRAP